jgi:hypothetical protein
MQRIIAIQNDGFNMNTDHLKAASLGKKKKLINETNINVLKIGLSFLK